MKTFCKVIAAACLACGWGAGAQDGAKPASTESAKPAMWRVQGVQGTVYLFGTVHVMKKGVAWETARVKDALKASNTLYVEIPEVDPAGVQALQPMIMKAGLDPEHPLSSKLTKQDVDALDAAVRKAGLPGEAMLEPMKPWLVYAMLTVLPALQSGYDAGDGVDATLAAEAKQLGKPVVGLETAEAQVNVLAGLSDAEQVKLLHQELADLPKSIRETDELVGEWSRGDVAKIAQRENDELKMVSPELYQKMLTDRNAGFAAKIDAMLKDPAGKGGFVAIGAAHLAGPDSVVAMLGVKGYQVERVE